MTTFSCHHIGRLGQSAAALTLLERTAFTIARTYLN